MPTPESTTRPRSLLFETFVVVGLLAIPATLDALFVLRNPEFSEKTAPYAQWGFFSQAIEQILLISLLWLVIRLKGERLSDFTEPLSKGDLFRGVGLAIAAYAAAWVAGAVILAVLPEITPPTADHPGTRPFQVPLSAAYLLSTIVNPHCEEFIMRGFLQTRLRQAGWSGVAVVSTSVLGQSAYHLYQGLLSTLSLAGVFLIFAVYYQRSRRLWPVVLAHLGMDLIAMLTHSRG